MQESTEITIPKINITLPELTGGLPFSAARAEAKWFTDAITKMFIKFGLLSADYKIK